MNLQSIRARLGRLEAERTPVGWGLVIQQIVETDGTATPTDEEVAAQEAAHDQSLGPVLKVIIQAVAPTWQGEPRP